MTSRKNSPWNSERYMVVSIFWKGTSAAEIVKMLGDGFTRNMVIGRAHRLGLDPISRAEIVRRQINGFADARSSRRGDLLAGVEE